MDTAAASPSSNCHGCSVPFPKVSGALPNLGGGMSPIGRYRCPECSNEFCADCDVFVHDVVHCCPGCGK